MGLWDSKDHCFNVYFVLSMTCIVSWPWILSNSLLGHQVFPHCWTSLWTPPPTVLFLFSPSFTEKKYLWKLSRWGSPRGTSPALGCEDSHPCPWVSCFSPHHTGQRIRTHSLLFLPGQHSLFLLPVFLLFLRLLFCDSPSSMRSR